MDEADAKGVGISVWIEPADADAAQKSESVRAMRGMPTMSCGVCACVYMCAVTSVVYLRAFGPN